MYRTLVFLALLAGPVRADAIEVFACEPEWASLVGELAGDLATVTAATTAFQDPHRLQAKPSLIAAIRRADMLVCTGADLEIGWLPLLLRRSGNRAIQPGAPGHVMASDFVRRLEVPTRIDRSEGDIHPQGNPHIHLNPRNIARVAQAVGERLAQVDPPNAAIYRSRSEDFADRWRRAMEGWEARGAALAGMRLVAHHRSFSYLADWLGLDIVASMEPKPGIPASTAYLASLLEQLQAQRPAAIIRTPYSDDRPSRWLSQRLDVPALVLPYTVGTENAADLFALFDTTIQTLAEAGP